MARKTKEQKDKEAKAKARVDKLVEDIELKTKDKKVLTNRIALLETEKGDNWLEDQLDAVTAENEDLKSKLSKVMSDLNQSKEDFKKLQASRTVAAPSTAPSGLTIEQKNKLKIFLMEMDNQLRGRNAARRPNDQVQIRYVVKKMMEVFPDII